MKTPSKSKSECDIEGNTPYDCRDIESSPYSDPCETGRDEREADIITRMEAAQQRFNPFPSLLVSAENERRLQLNDRAESERQILRCAPPFDALAEHEADLRYESRVDYESWQYDGPAEMEDA